MPSRFFGIRRILFRALDFGSGSKVNVTELRCLEWYTLRCCALEKLRTETRFVLSTKNRPLRKLTL